MYQLYIHKTCMSIVFAVGTFGYLRYPYESAISILSLISQSFPVHLHNSRLFHQGQSLLSQYSGNTQKCLQTNLCSCQLFSLLFLCVASFHQDSPLATLAAIIRMPKPFSWALSSPRSIASISWAICSLIICTRLGFRISSRSKSDLVITLV